MSAVPAAALLAALAFAALLADSIWTVAAIVIVLLVPCLRAPRAHRRLYLASVAISAGSVFLLWPWLQNTGSHPFWHGPIVPVLGELTVTREELWLAGLYALRFAAVGLASAAYVLLLDHDRLLGAASWARRSALSVALATRLVPTLERDAVGLVEALRGRGVEVEGARARARLLSPLLAGSLERGLNLAEAMEARGFGRPGRTRVPTPPWTVVDLSFSYPGADRQALAGVSLEIEPGEFVALLGTSGSGKSTLLRALSGLVPHFHGGRFAGRVVVGGRDTRTSHPADLAGTVATVFQEPEDQVVLTRVLAEVAFGLENLGTAPAEIVVRATSALAAIGAEHLAERPVAELSGGELQRVCLASALALEPELLLLDEPSSQLDRDAAEALFDHARAHGCAVVVAEQRPELPLAFADRIVFLRDGQIADELPPPWTEQPTPPLERASEGEEVVRLERVSYAYPAGRPVLVDESLSLRRGEVVALVGPNGVGKTTLAKVAAGLTVPGGGRVLRFGSAAYLPQDPGRYLVTETVLAEVSLAAGEERAWRALDQLDLTAFAKRHPRDLSSGERERLAIATVLAIDPDLLVLDEPTRGVDPERKRELAALLRAQAPSRATLVVTHDRVFATCVGDRTIALGSEAVLV